MGTGTQVFDLCSTHKRGKSLSSLVGLVSELESMNVFGSLPFSSKAKLASLVSNISVPHDAQLLPIVILDARDSSLACGPLLCFGGKTSCKGLGRRFVIAGTKMLLTLAMPSFLAS